MKLNGLKALMIIFMVFLPNISFAESATIYGTGEYVAGDNDTILEARGLAMQEAKRDALEKVGTYLESCTEVKNSVITKDEIRMFTAGIIAVEQIKEERRLLENKGLLVTISVRATVDSSEVTRKIESFRHDNKIRQSVANLQKENKELISKIKRLNEQLKSKSTEDSYSSLRRMREEALHKLVENDQGMSVLLSGKTLADKAVSQKDQIEAILKEMITNIEYKIESVEPFYEKEKTTSIEIRVSYKIPADIFAKFEDCPAYML